MLGKLRLKLFHPTVILLKVELDAVDLSIIVLEPTAKIIQRCLALVLLLIGDFSDLFAHGLVNVSRGIRYLDVDHIVKLVFHGLV